MVETLVAITILIFSITAATTATQTALSNSIFARNQVVAFFLAQEAVEYIRNTRDTNVLQASNWLSGFASPGTACEFGKVCTVDATVGTSAFSTCTSGAGTCPVLRQSTSGIPLYGYNGTWSPSIYRREITLQQIGADEIAVIVNVTFSKGLLSRTITVRESVFNWQ